MPKLVVAMAIAGWTAGALYPQRLYNQAQDTRATEAKTAAEALSSGRAFENALSNLGELLTAGTAITLAWTNRRCWWTRRCRNALIDLTLASLQTVL